MEISHFSIEMATLWLPGVPLLSAKTLLHAQVLIKQAVPHLNCGRKQQASLTELPDFSEWAVFKHFINILLIFF